MKKLIRAKAGVKLERIERLAARQSVGENVAGDRGEPYRDLAQTH